MTCASILSKGDEHSFMVQVQEATASRCITIPKHFSILRGEIKMNDNKRLLESIIDEIWLPEEEIEEGSPLSLMPDGGRPCPPWECPGPPSISKDFCPIPWSS